MQKWYLTGTTWRPGLIDEAGFLRHWRSTHAYVIRGETIFSLKGDPLYMGQMPFQVDLDEPVFGSQA